jgi:hypothetical protein
VIMTRGLYNCSFTPLDTWVSIKLVEHEIRRFLSSSEPEVTCITGRWGVGKTFAWKKYLSDASSKKQIALGRYSYVSLFGINSLEDFKYSIFENSVKSSEIGIEPSLETLRSNTTAAAERLGRKSLSFIQQIPIVKNYLGPLGPAWFLTVRNTIVCVDDIERRGANLSTREVLGLASMLKEQRGCKLALILNADALEDDQEEFRRYYEKVVDTSLNFSPSPAECASIGIQADTNGTKLLTDDCVKLGISNIRLMKRIERSVRDAEKMLTGFDPQVLTQAVHSLALLGWSVYEPNSAPAIDFLENKRGKVFYAEKDHPVPENEAAWNALLDAYGFTSMDALDLALLGGLRCGYFDPELIEKHSSELNSQFTSLKLNNSFKQSWDLYHESFGNNQDEVLDAMYNSFMSSAKQITPLNMNSTVALFKILGRPEQAAKMISHYVEERGNEPGLFDPQSYLLFGEVSDPDVSKAFKEKHASLEKKVDPTAILRSIANTNSWNPEDVASLSAMSSDHYYQMFKESKGQDLRQLIKVCLQFDQFGNASPEMKEVSKRAREALTRIANESPINARRAKPYGIEATSKPTVPASETL